MLLYTVHDVGVWLSLSGILATMCYLGWMTRSHSATILPEKTIRRSEDSATSSRCNDGSAGSIVAVERKCEV